MPVASTDTGSAHCRFVVRPTICLSCTGVRPAAAFRERDLSGSCACALREVPEAFADAGFLCNTILSRYHAQEESSGCFVDLLLLAARALGPVIRRFISLGLNRVWLKAGDTAYRCSLCPPTPTRARPSMSRRRWASFASMHACIGCLLSALHASLLE